MFSSAKCVISMGKSLPLGIVAVKTSVRLREGSNIYKENEQLELQ